MELTVEHKFASYPGEIRATLMEVRQIILDCAEDADLGSVHESLKWGEPSYSVVGGSPVRIGWQSKSADQYAIFFNCNTTLVETFKELYRDSLQFEGKRALVLGVADKIPHEEIKHCVSLALQYHKIKHLPLLGQ